MYPSNSNGNNTYPLDQATPYWPSLYDINPYSKPPEEDPFSSLFHFPPPPYIPYEDDVILLQHLHDILLQQQQQPLTAAPEAVANMEKSNNNDLDGRKEQISRKRSSKKDRHTKITTAQGQRDRRMRLSLDVARKFFRLQDTLGFDKASKTVEWLLIKSKSAIKELTSGLPHMKQRCSTVAANSTASSTSECEVVSGIDESAVVDGNRPAVRKPSESSSSPKQKKSTRALRKSAFHPLARESRDKARARARERTIEKRRLDDESKLPLEAMNHDMNRLGFWSPFENGQGSGTQTHNINPHLQYLADGEELSSSVIFNYDLQNRGISQEFTDFEVYGKPWEPYNINLC